MPSILQDWVQELGLRQQGVLVSAVRGCDDLPGKKNPAKALSRYFRAVILKAHCGDPMKSKSFIEWCEDETQFKAGVDAWLDVCDRMPLHFVLHFIHAAQLVGYFHPSPEERDWWLRFYLRIVHRLHLNPETKEQMHARLDVEEERFGREPPAILDARKHVWQRLYEGADVEKCLHCTLQRRAAGDAWQHRVNETAAWLDAAPPAVCGVYALPHADRGHAEDGSMLESLGGRARR